jgi:SAM-dependent methyltransferase
VDLQAMMADRYASGSVPWDDPLPPPEVRSLVTFLPPGRALDLGCGYGRSSIFLAQHGWEADGVDFVAAAIVEARVRAESAGVRAHFHQATVSDLSFLFGPYDLAVDVGCLHNLDAAAATACRDELLRLLRHGGLFLLFARLSEGGEGEFGMGEEQLRALFADAFALERIERGRSAMPDGSSWPSAWLWYRRLPADAGATGDC